MLSRSERKECMILRDVFLRLQSAKAVKPSGAAQRSNASGRSFQELMPYRRMDEEIPRA